MGSFAIGQNFDLAGFGYTDGPPVAYFIKFQKGNKIEISWYDAKEQKVKKSYKYQKKYIGRFPLFELDADMPDDLYANLDPQSKEYLGNKFMLLTGLAKKAWKENEDGIIGLGMLPARKGKKKTNKKKKRLYSFRHSIRRRLLRNPYSSCHHTTKRGRADPGKPKRQERKLLRRLKTYPRRIRICY